MKTQRASADATDLLREIEECVSLAGKGKVPKFEVVIEYDQFIAGRELSEIIEVLDEAVWDEIEEELYDFPAPLRFIYPIRRYNEQAPSIFCIAEVNKGSLILTGFIGGAAATYCYNRFKKSFRKSGRTEAAIDRLGTIADRALGRIIEKVNDCPLRRSYGCSHAHVRDQQAGASSHSTQRAPIAPIR